MLVPTAGRRSLAAALRAVPFLALSLFLYSSLPLYARGPSSQTVRPASVSSGLVFTVNSTDDVVDAAPGNGVCDTGRLSPPAPAVPECTLRAAVQEVNARANGADEIDLPAGTYFLTLTGGLEDSAATGDLDLRVSVSIVGAGADVTEIDGQDIDRVFDVDPASTGITVTISKVLISHGTVSASGDYGGAIRNRGTLTLVDAGVYSSNAIGPGTESRGGGVYSSGSLTLVRSTVAGNGSSYGSGIYIENPGSLTATNTTIAGNFSTTGTGSGGGLAQASAQTLTLKNVTVSANSAATQGGGIARISLGGPAPGPVSIQNTIVAANSAPASADISGVVASAGNNLIGDVSGSGGFVGSDLQGVAAHLLSLDLNAPGHTETIALQSNSPAINAGANLSGLFTTDQRGVVRPQGSAWDIGAYEANPVPDLTIAKSHVGNFTQGQSNAQYTLTVTNAGPVATSATVAVLDFLPPSMTAVAMAGTGWNCSTASVSCDRSDPLGSLASYPPIVLTVQVAPDAPASANNAAQVFGGGQADTTNDIATDPTTIVAASDLTIMKSHAGDFTQGQSGQYSIVVGNGGSVATSGSVTVTDPAPAGFTLTGLSGTGWNCVLASSSCTRSNALAPGGSYPPITATFFVGFSAASITTNVATVSGGGEVFTGNDSASDPTTVIQSGIPLGALIPDGRATTTVLPSNGAEYRASPAAGRSYSFEVDVPFEGEGTLGGGPFPLLAVTRADGSALATPPADRSGCAAADTARFTFMPTAADLAGGPLRLVVGDAVSFNYRYRARLVDTTLFAPFWTTNGYTALVDLQNTGECTVTGQVIFFNAAGAPIGNMPFSLAAASASQTAISAGLSANAGSAQIVHDGPAGSLTAGIYMVVPNSPVGRAFRWWFLEPRSYGSSDGK